MIQPAVGVFVCLWWGTLGGAKSGLVGAALLLGSLCVLAGALAEIWRESDARIPPGATGAAILAVVALTSRSPTADQLTAAIVVYGVVFALVAVGRSIRLAGETSVPVTRRVSLALAGLVALELILG